MREGYGTHPASRSLALDRSPGGAWPTVPSDGECARLPEDDAAGRGRVRVDGDPGPSIQHGVEGGDRLQFRQVDPDAGVRALGEREVRPGVRPRKVEDIGFREGRR